MSPELKRQLLQAMLRIRLVEERIGVLYAAQDMRCPCHLAIGQEAVAVGTCAPLEPTDTLFGTYRSHGLYLAKGGDLNALIAELYGKETGCTRGRGGSMQVVAPEAGLICTSAIVGATIPMAVGAALSATRRHTSQVSAVVFGDGATEEGIFHESLNFASLRRLPVVFVCENNRYACYSHQRTRQAVDNIFQRAAAHGIPGQRVDGNDVIAVYEGVAQAVRRARLGQGPSLIECRTYRWREHVGPNDDTHLGYRSLEEITQWKARCPIARWSHRLNAEGLLSSGQMAQWTAEITQELDAAVACAKQSPFPRIDDLADGIYAEAGR